MAMETAAAILTKLALEQNAELKSRLNGAHGEAKVVAVIMPLFRQILSELEEGRQAHDSFPSAVPSSFSGRSDSVPASGSGKVKDVHAEERHSEGDDIGGEG